MATLSTPVQCAAIRVSKPRDIGILAAAYTGSFLIVSGFPHTMRGFPLDDSWIHQVIARNLAQYHTLGFIPGVWSSGSTSILWTLILAAKWAVFPALNPVIYCAVLNVVLLMAIGAGLLALSRKDGLPEYLCWFIAFAPALDGNFIWLSLTGMEHLLFVALSIAAIYFWFQLTRPAILAALCLGALSLTRPEGMVLAAILIGAARWSGRSRRDAAKLAALVGLCFLAFIAVNLKTAHSWMPATYAGRKWLYFGTTSVPPRAMCNFPIGLAILGSVRPWEATGSGFLFIPVLLLVDFGVLRLLFKTPCLRMLCIWMFTLIGIYAVMLPSLFNEGRYQAVLLCLLLPLMCAGLDQICESAGVRAKLRIAALAALCLLSATRSLLLWRNITRAGISLVQNTHERAAQFIAESLPHNAKIAALDIGVLGYADGASRVEDLGGLTDSSYLPYLQEHRILDYLDNSRAPYLMWVLQADGSSDMPQMLTINQEFRSRFSEIAVFCADARDWNLSNRNHAQCQGVFQRVAH